MRLGPRDLLLLYTDGLIDRENPDGEPYGLERLRALVGRFAKDGARRIVDALLAAASEHGRGEPLRDDMTVVAVRRL